MSETAMTGEVEALVAELTRRGSIYRKMNATTVLTLEDRAADALARLTAELASRNLDFAIVDGLRRSAEARALTAEAALAKAVEG